MLRDRTTGEELTPGKPHALNGERFKGTLTVFKDEMLMKQHGVRAHVCICGEFMKPTPAHQCYTGQAFEQPVNLPRGWIAKLGSKLLRRWSPSLHVDASSSHPYFLAPLLGVASRVQCAADDTEPLQVSREPPLEDHNLVRELSSRIPSGHRARRGYFSKGKCDGSVAFVPGRQYSFHFTVLKLDLDTFKLCGLPRPFDIHLDGHLRGQPLRLLGVCSCDSASPAPPPSGDTLWDVEIWSERQCAEGAPSRCGPARGPSSIDLAGKL